MQALRDGTDVSRGLRPKPCADQLTAPNQLWVHLRIDVCAYQSVCRFQRGDRCDSDAECVDRHGDGRRVFRTIASRPTPTPSRPVMMRSSSRDDASLGRPSDHSRIHL